ncbi:MAG TPA: potassium-transporting ATPase subunit KdpC [Hydrogenophaga sp.]|uniref:potassium-transporting ATPase subunit KdpC n=1 Tax=Hydrogenophaga sp. TaxID=1904254 RepID=UPI002CFAFED4|nr:potassium-transporting ATPase subunit KdpC [Hydrogenophaga sp.]HSX95264.1 potassium-transporting ATPase subunit KdpC [Hydrogenophaga sp.]
MTSDDTPTPREGLGTMLRAAVLLFLLLSVVTGLLYPLLITGAAQALFPRQANGSLIERDGQAVGSALIGQTFTEPRYFWGRPSATGPVPYNAAASGGSNLGPTSEPLHTAVRERLAALRAADPGNTAPVPVDLVTASGSGLDPHISLAAARYQIDRVARARGLAADGVRALVERQAQRPLVPGLGEPRVNVLELNLAMDAAATPVR